MKLSAMDLNLFLVLQMVLEERSVTRAARRLHVTPPAISNALARLREQLHDPLLVRSGRGLVPTPRAVQLLPRLREALAGLEEVATEGMEFEPSREQRTFSLVCSDVDQLSLVPALTREFNRCLPLATLQVLSIDHLEAMGGMERAEIDAAIAPAWGEPGGLRAVTLYEDEGVLVVRQGHPGVKGRLTREVFNRLRHVDIRVALGARGIGNKMAMAFFKQHGLTRTVVAEVPAFSTAVMVAASTDLATGVPRRIAETYARLLPLQVLEIPAPPMRFAMQLQWHERTQRDPGSRYFRELVIRMGSAPAKPGTKKARGPGRS